MSGDRFAMAWRRAQWRRSILLRGLVILAGAAGFCMALKLELSSARLGSALLVISIGMCGLVGLLTYLRVREEQAEYAWSMVGFWVTISLGLAGLIAYEVMRWT